PWPPRRAGRTALLPGGSGAQAVRKPTARKPAVRKPAVRDLLRSARPGAGCPGAGCLIPARLGPAGPAGPDPAGPGRLARRDYPTGAVPARPEGRLARVRRCGPARWAARPVPDRPVRGRPVRVCDGRCGDACPELRKPPPPQPETCGNERADGCGRTALAA